MQGGALGRIAHVEGPRNPRLGDRHRGTADETIDLRDRGGATMYGTAWLVVQILILSGALVATVLALVRAFRKGR